MICQLQLFLNKDSQTTVVHPLVTARLDYCNELYVGLPFGLVWKLQLVQNMVARLLVGAPGQQDVTKL